MRAKVKSITSAMVTRAALTHLDPLVHVNVGVGGTLEETVKEGADIIGRRRSSERGQEQGELETSCRRDAVEATQEVGLVRETC